VVERKSAEFGEVESEADVGRGLQWTDQASEVEVGGAINRLRVMRERESVRRRVVVSQAYATRNIPSGVPSFTSSPVKTNSRNKQSKS
jgi:hypothetical protein